ncbi:nucleotide disphospho-sugar-binding domain-containing protein [Streptomyces sp. HD]|uniref:nucleotide disphospho-sugar-binding domain-containing protein n=1 Tax=Streptomyces sp. HD TaxID=3020892 RepID=UPI00232E7903|nr:nucleotide disphospho-sugar-binding domain-containing protein [Streptomyces sp. HD]MDC0772581.1 DUF1205 domain-containing protein [Streptomyces sp. HD]
MRVLFVTWATPGHLFPMVPLAWAFQAAGHDVRVAAPDSCATAIGHAGLSAVPTGAPVDLRALSRPEDTAVWDTDKHWPAGWPGRPELLSDGQTRMLAFAAERQHAVAGAMLDELLAFARWFRPELVIHDPLAFAGPVAAAVLGVPSLAHGWEVATVLGSERSRRRDGYAPGYAALFERYGAEPRPCTARVIDPSPPGMRGAISTGTEVLDMRYVPYNGPSTAPFPPAAQGGRPRICFTSGVALGKYEASDLTRAVSSMLDLTSGLDVDTVLAIGPGQRDLLPTLPPGTLVAENTPFHLLLPLCDAVVHHGGAGTAMTAVATGVPQLVIAQSPIYTEVGRSVAAGGAGIVLTEDQQRPATVTEALSRLLDGASPYRAALAAVREEMAAMPSPAQVAADLARTVTAA